MRILSRSIEWEQINSLQYIFYVAGWCSGNSLHFYSRASSFEYRQSHKSSWFP